GITALYIFNIFTLLLSHISKENHRRIQITMAIPKVHDTNIFHPVLVFMVISAAISTNAMALNTAEVTGVAKCTDSPQNTIKGTSVRVVCKLPNGETKTMGETEVKAGEEKFRVSLPREMLQEDGKQLKGECFAVLHQTHCPSRARLDKLVFGSKTVDDKHVFVPAGGVIRYSTTACLSYRKLLSGGPIVEALGNAVRRVTTACQSYPKGCVEKIELAKKILDMLNGIPDHLPGHKCQSQRLKFTLRNGYVWKGWYITPDCKVHYGPATKP
ncbi:hypothetical protein Drorol1_Dr00012394, partial [Drosera rotundifolia]